MTIEEIRKQCVAQALKDWPLIHLTPNEIKVKLDNLTQELVSKLKYATLVDELESRRVNK